MTTTSNRRPSGLHRLASGALVEVDEHGVASPLFCSWLIERPSFNPEPDSEADCWIVEPCGERLLGTDHADGYTCDAGHEHLPIEVAWAAFGPEWERESRERFAETGSVV